MRASSISFCLAGTEDCQTVMEKVVSLTLKPVECGHDSFVDTELVTLMQEWSIVAVIVFERSANRTDTGRKRVAECALLTPACKIVRAEKCTHTPASSILSSQQQQQQQQQNIYI